jgi:hypothetical protein
MLEVKIKFGMPDTHAPWYNFDDTLAYLDFMLNGDAIQGRCGAITTQEHKG